MNTVAKFLGCFVSGPAVNWDDAQDIKDLAKENGAKFRKYIWGEQDISNTLNTFL